MTLWYLVKSDGPQVARYYYTLGKTSLDQTGEESYLADINRLSTNISQELQSRIVAPQKEMLRLLANLCGVFVGSFTFSLLFFCGSPRVNRETHCFPIYSTHFWSEQNYGQHMAAQTSSWPQQIAPRERLANAPQQFANLLKFLQGRVTLLAH